MISQTFDKQHLFITGVTSMKHTRGSCLWRQAAGVLLVDRKIGK